MSFLARELDDGNPAPCGPCAVCRGGPIVSETCPPVLVDATRFSAATAPSNRDANGRIMCSEARPPGEHPNEPSRQNGACAVHLG